MKKIFINIENSLNQRLIISQAELASFLTGIFLKASITNEGAEAEFKESASFHEKMIGLWLLRVCRSVQWVPTRLLSELKTIVPIRSVSANVLPNTLWHAIFEYLSLRERANRMHISKTWHHLAQNSRVTEVISPIKQLNELGMIYLLIYNWRKKCRLLLTAQEPTPESVKQLGLTLSSFYLLYREEKFQREQLFYASSNQFVCLDMEKKNFERFHYTLRIDGLKYDKPRDLSGYELEIMKSMTGDTPRDLLPTIKCLREKMQTVLDTSNDLAYMKELRHLNSQSEISRLLQYALWAIFLQMIVGVLGCSSKPSNDRLSRESCYILDKSVLITLFIVGGLYLLMRTASRNRCARSIEKRVEKITRTLSPSSKSTESFHRLEHDLKEYAIPSIVRERVYFWKGAESKTIPQKIQIKVDQFKDQIIHKKAM